MENMFIAHILYSDVMLGTLQSFSHTVKHTALKPLNSQRDVFLGVCVLSPTSINCCTFVVSIRLNPADIEETTFIDA